MPLLAISFLAMGLACTGFPGTLGFVGQELLVDGAVDAFPVMGFAVVIASALTGLAVLRMYFSLFCGRPDAQAHSSLRFGLTPRETWTFVALVTALIGFGVAPRPLVDSRFAASNTILQLRQTGMLGGQKVAGGTNLALPRALTKAGVENDSRRVRHESPGSGNDFVGGPVGARRSLEPGAVATSPRGENKANMIR
jgi:NADH:ubiquinone oxidoreductase subunit 5 (subunit L)/multisubunit Na+/H+ antiporter MnhA subunit